MAGFSIDRVFRRLLLTKFYTNGWGSEHDLLQFIKFRRILGNRKKCAALVPADWPITIDKVKVKYNRTITCGHFRSPAADVVPGALPKESETCYFEMILPNQWLTKYRQPICVHLAGTGDHGLSWRRHKLAIPLLDVHIGSIIIENPFYGRRKPRKQWRSGLLHVNDVFVLGGSLALETLVLLQYCEQQGHGPFAVSGASLGGHNAALAGPLWHDPIAIVPCLNGITGAATFTQGPLARSCKWSKLDEELNSYHMRGIDDVPSYLMQQIEGVELTSEGGRVYKDKLHPHNDFIVPKYDVPRSYQYPDILRLQEKHKESFDFMHWLMNEVSHLGRMEKPVKKSRVINVLAKYDEYMPTYSGQLEDIWDDCETRYVKGGHVMSCVNQWSVIREAILDALETLPFKPK